MRKILSLVLVGMIAAVTLWAKPVAFKTNLDGEEYLFVSDDENKVLPVDASISDDEIIRVLIDDFPSEIADKHYKCIESAFIELDAFTKEYPQYWIINEKKGIIAVYQSLSDGRVVALVFKC